MADDEIRLFQDDDEGPLAWVKAGGGLVVTNSERNDFVPHHAVVSGAPKKSDGRSSVAESGSVHLRVDEL